MTSLTCGMENITQMNLSMKQEQTHRHREQTCGCPGEKQQTGTLELADTNYCVTIVQHREVQSVSSDKPVIYTTE